MECADHNLFLLFAEYYGLTPQDVFALAKNYRGINEHQWQECAGSSWRERALSFYESAEGYVFDLVHSNQSKAHLIEIYREFAHLPWFERSGPQVLEFGGGLGLWCSLMRDLGREVTYVDVDGAASRFARWYFERTEQRDIEVVLTPSERLVLPTGRQWDFVYSDSVIEHLVDPGGTVDTLARATRPGGVLYLLIDAHRVEEGFPMHRHVHLDELFAASPTLRAMEHVLHQGDGYNVFRAPAR
ncbi:MAG: methyltransferase domain-containing protein [Planctomycetes bacterium]|nr:methyltransferase domain-containing protein [Planctomycetota bacterium]